ncbi:MAG: NAD(P)/FAD-dependent oxidoreductase, partial [Solirubrobacteraceae bacterium]
MSPPRRIVVVGASLAGLRAAEALRGEGFSGELALLGQEREAPYDRPPLSKAVLLGERDRASVVLTQAQDLKASWRLGEAAVGLDVATRTLRTSADEELDYDGLVICTGSSPRRLRGLEPDGQRVLELRTLADSLRLRELLSTAAKALIVGCGFIGMEIASAAAARGLGVTMVGPDPPLAVAGPLASEVATELLARGRVELRVPHVLSALERRAGGVEGILDGGETIAADFAVIAVGATPNVQWLQGSGLRLDDGLLCDACLRALEADSIVAAGDVASWPNPLLGGARMRVEHWTNAVEQAAAAASTLLAGAEAEPFASLPSVWSDHFGTRFQALGAPARAPRVEVLAGAVDEGRFAALALRGEEPVGAIVYGMPREFAKLRARL